MSDSTIVSPVITRPEDNELLAKLERKLKEYKARADTDMDYHHPQQAYLMNANYRDSLFKSLVLEKLLTDGKIVTYDFCNELAEQYKPFDGNAFQNACGVIAMYCGQLDMSKVTFMQEGTGLK